MRMIDQKRGDVNLDQIEELQLRSLYDIAGLQFVIPDGVVKGSYQILKSEEETNQNSLRVKITSKDKNFSYTQVEVYKYLMIEEQSINGLFPYWPDLQLTLFLLAQMILTMKIITAFLL